MSDENGNCKQGEKIGKIEAAIDFMHDFLERHEDRENKMLEYMAAVAAQSETLKAHAVQHQENKAAIAEAFQLIRARKNLAIRTLEGDFGNYIIGGLIVIDAALAVSHWPTVWAFVKALRG